MSAAPAADPSGGVRGAAPPEAVDDPFAHCAEVVRANAKNFYYAFVFAPRERRRALYALYAFARLADDIVDEPGDPADQAARLEGLRAGLDAALAGRAEGPVLAAVADVVRRHGLDPRHLHAIVDGCAMDLARTRYETFADLAVYLDRVSSAVGRLVMQLHGVDPAARADYARAGGQAVQLTNIIRDIREDRGLGRVYLPQEDLRRFGVREEDLDVARAPGENVRALVRFQIARARALYAQARADAVLPPAERRRIYPLESIVRIYSRLLDAIERRDGDVFGERVRLPGWRKGLLGLGTLVRAKLRLPAGR